MVTTILSKMKWKKFLQETRYLREGRCGRKAGGTGDEKAAETKAQKATPRMKEHDSFLKTGRGF